LGGFYIRFLGLHLLAVGSLYNIEQDLGVIMSTTTKADFELFKKEVQKWIDILGLRDWEVHFTQSGFENDDRAGIHVNLNGRIARIGLNKNQTSDFNDLDIRKWAFHEVCELLLGPLSVNARSRYINEDELEQSEHYIIRTLENILFSKY